MDNDKTIEVLKGLGYDIEWPDYCFIKDNLLGRITEEGILYIRYQIIGINIINDQLDLIEKLKQNNIPYVETGRDEARKYFEEDKFQIEKTLERL